MTRLEIVPRLERKDPLTISPELHAMRVDQIATTVKAWYESGGEGPLQNRRPSTNSTRNPQAESPHSIDLSGMDHVIKIDKEKRTATVQAGISMEALVTATLEEGLLPPVVPEFRKITAGGAVSGGGIESTSHRHGLFFDSVAGLEVVLGDGEIKWLTPEDEKLFYGFSGAMGTLGIITAVEVNLERTSTHVKVKTLSYGDPNQAVKKLQELAEIGEHDFVEGVIYSPRHAVVIVGKKLQKLPHPDTVVQTYTNRKDPWFYDDILAKTANAQEYEEIVPIVDYLFRSDRGAFWMGHQGLDKLPRAIRDWSRVIFDKYLTTARLYQWLHLIQTAQNHSVRDSHLPFHRAKEYLAGISEKYGIYPIWLCPVKVPDTARMQLFSPHNFPGETHVLNVGVYGDLPDEGDSMEHLLQMEKIAQELEGIEMLYAHVYRGREVFQGAYDWHSYEKLREKLHAVLPDGRQAFRDIWEKVYVSEHYEPRKFRGTITFWKQILLEKLRQL